MCCLYSFCAHVRVAGSKWWHESREIHSSEIHLKFCSSLRDNIITQSLIHLRVFGRERPFEWPRVWLTMNCILVLFDTEHSCNSLSGPLILFSYFDSFTSLVLHSWIWMTKKNDKMRGWIESWIVSESYASTLSHVFILTSLSWILKSASVVHPVLYTLLSQGFRRRCRFTANGR